MNNHILNMCNMYICTSGKIWHGIFNLAISFKFNFANHSSHLKQLGTKLKFTLPTKFKKTLQLKLRLGTGARNFSYSTIQSLWAYSPPASSQNFNKFFHHNGVLQLSGLRTSLLYMAWWITPDQTNTISYHNSL